jgi:8-oxo-dGTP pyrophosphatase MutT (NUDIX family)
MRMMNRESFLTRFLFSRLAPPLLDHSQKHKFKKAAVMIALVERKGILHIIFTERALHLRHHPGQVSFPGGKYELSDKNLQQTAIRETEEEIGIQPHLMEIIGQLAPLKTVSGFEVLPIIAFVDNKLILDIDAQEVKSVFEVPLHFLLDKNNFYKQYLIANKTRHFTYYIGYQNHLIWGATAQILKNLQLNLEQTKNIQSKHPESFLAKDLRDVIGTT